MGLPERVIQMWMLQRLHAGQEKYKNAHLRRNGLDDIREELLDAQNIAYLMIDRFSKQWQYVEQDKETRINNLVEHLVAICNLALQVCDILEDEIPAEYLTDEESGGRIFITEWRETNQSKQYKARQDIHGNEWGSYEVTKEGNSDE